MHAIGQTVRDNLTAEVLDAFPIRLNDNIYFCGFASEHTYGAASYLIQRDEGNILVDVPRFFSRLVRNIERLGGISRIFLTHRDDIAGHEDWARHFGCGRIMHGLDHPPAAIEMIIEGENQLILADDLMAIPTPGHTRGSMCLLHKQTLFSGDHLAGAQPGQQAELLSFRDACWYSWAEVKRSNQRLLDYDFRRVLPGHGYRFEVADADAARAALQRLIGRMDS